MKKIKYTFLLVLCLVGFTTLQAQEQFSMTTKLNSGQEFSFTVNYGVEVDVDWGNGQWTKHTSYGDPITGTLAGQVVTVKGFDITLLECAGQSLTQIDLTDLPNLGTLICPNNELTSLTIIPTKKLRKLNAANNQLTSIAIGTVNTLQEVVVNNNQLTSLSISFNRYLQSLICNDNKLTNLSLGTLVNIKTLWCQNNELTTLNVSRSTALETLMCQNNKLTTLNVTGLTALTDIWCDGNLMTDLDLSTSSVLSYVSADNGKLENLIFGDVSQLTALYLNNNRLGYAGLVSTENVANYVYNPQDSLRIPASFDTETVLDLSAQLYTADSVETNASFKWYDGEKLLLANTDYTEEAGKFKFNAKHAELHGEISSSLFPNLPTIHTTMAVVLAGTSVNDTKADNSLSISVRDGKLLIHSHVEQPLQIFSMTGALVRSFDRISGQVELELPRGTYIVNRTKIIL